eukprot:958532-Prymnesium_polylepis.1
MRNAAIASLATVTELAAHPPDLRLSRQRSLLLGSQRADRVGDDCGDGARRHAARQLRTHEHPQLSLIHI